MLTIAKNLDQAYNGKGEYRAGATDVIARYRMGIRSEDMIDISRLEELKQVEWHGDGRGSIGALVKIAALAEDDKIKQYYPALTKAAGGLATPQIRRMATVGGSLLQHTRCWYYRHPDFKCYKKGGDHCPAREGNHQYGVCFDLGPCVFPHPSTLGMVFLAYDAGVRLHDASTISIANLYGMGTDPTIDHLLGENDLVTHIVLPLPLEGEKSIYTRAISRFEAEWPLVETIVRLQISNGMIQFARVVLGGVANIPMALPHVDKVLKGQPADSATFRRAAEKAIVGANPLPMTEYKIKLVYGSVLDALERAAAL